MSFFGFGQSADIDIQLDGMECRKMAEIKSEDGKKERYYLYYDGETVSGKVNVSLKKPGSRFEHQGIKIEFIGQIELYYDRGNHHEFASLVKELARPGEMTHNTSYDFEFNQVEKPYESYSGTNVRLRYFLRVTVVRRITDTIREMELLVHTLSSYPEMNNSIKMEVGIEDCLHIEFEYNKSKYHLKDVIVGKIYFLLVRIKIKHMEIAIIKKETTGSGPNTFNENDTIAKYEIMDGAPVRGESIPIRVFLAGYDLTPTMRDINKKFSVRYYLNLVLVDEEERRYFKQQEITLWRKGERVRRPLQQQIMAQQLAFQQLSLNHTNSENEKVSDAHHQNAVVESSPASLKFKSQNSDDLESPVLPKSAVEPPSPHQSQSPMQEESPIRSTHLEEELDKQQLSNPSSVKPLDDDDDDALNTEPTKHCDDTTVDQVPSRLPAVDKSEGVHSIKSINTGSTPIRQTILADSPPPLPTQEQDDDYCSPDLPTPPDDVIAGGLESPEDEFAEAISASPPSEMKDPDGGSGSNSQNPVPVAQ